MKNNSTIIRGLMLLSVLIFSTSVNAATYTTIADGSWDNMTDVWSLNGVDACACAPNSTTEGDNIVIRHQISTTTNLIINKGSQFTVTAGGDYSGMHIITILNGTVTFNGGGSLSKIIVNEGSELNVIESVLMLSNRLSVEGQVLVDAGYIAMSNGNIDILTTGEVITKNSGKLDAYGGNIENFGVVDICSSCCMTTKGNWKNHGTVRGSGSATTTNGNMSNDGIWGNDVTWCSVGFDTGMPTPEDCGTANEVCGMVMLPVELAAFDVVNFDGCIYISWETLSELNTDKFVVLKSTDGREWSTVAIVKAAGTSNEKLSYSLFDYDSEFDVAFYRLKQVDRDGEHIYSYIRSIVGSDDDELTVYPNPIKEGALEPLMINLPRAAEVTLLSSDGATVICPQTAIESLALDLSNFRAGVYIIQIEYLDGGSDSRRVMIADY